MNNIKGEKNNIENINKKETELKKIKRLVILLFLLLFLLISGIGFAIYYKINSQVVSEDAEMDLDARLGILPGMSLEEIRNRLNTFVEEGMMNVSIATELIFPNGKARGRLGIENIAANHYDYIVTISLKDTGEEVYKSGIISPGYYVNTARLKKVLPKGDHKAIALFEAYVPGEKNVIGAVRAEVTIRILN